MTIDLKPTDILIAPPSLDDEQFSETVIVLINHNNATGSVGLCVNRPLFFTVEDIISDDTIHPDLLSEDIYWGGPVQEETLWILHTTDWSIENTIKLSDDWGITSNKKMFSRITDCNRPEYMRLFMGFCSWEANQLQSEILGQTPFNKQDAWLVITDMTLDEPLDAEIDDMWARACEIACAQAVDKVFEI